MGSQSTQLGTGESNIMATVAKSGKAVFINSVFGRFQVFTQRGLNVTAQIQAFATANLADLQAVIAAGQQSKDPATAKLETLWANKLSAPPTSSKASKSSNT